MKRDVHKHRHSRRTLGGVVALVWQLAFAAVGPLIDKSLSAQLRQTLLQTGVRRPNI